MKKLIMLVFAGFLMQGAYSQTNVVEFLKGGKADASALTKAYLNPYAMALGDGLNNGWYNSAKTHKLFGFDLNISASVIQIPDKDKTFDISTLGLTNLSIASGGNIAPTVAGAKVPGPKLQMLDKPLGRRALEYRCQRRYWQAHHKTDHQSLQEGFEVIGKVLIEVFQTF